MKSIVSLTLLCTASLVSGAVIGIEPFNTDGALDGQSGGTGFDYDQAADIDADFIGAPSDWESNATVTGGVLVTNNTNGFREYNGITEGGGGDERDGAFRGEGLVTYQFEITRRAGASWSGVSSFDFGTEKVFFGVPGGAGPSGGLEFGVQLQNYGGSDAPDGQFAWTGIQPATDVTYTIVAVLDFMTNPGPDGRVGLFVNPDPTDFWDTSGGTADATMGYNATNWASEVRVASGGEVEWDNLMVATDPADFGLIGVPEPVTGFLGLAGALLLYRRRR